MTTNFSTFLEELVYVPKCFPTFEMTIKVLDSLEKHIAHLQHNFDQCLSNLIHKLFAPYKVYQ